MKNKKYKPILKLKKPHHDRCITELDPEGLQPCNCGAYGGQNSIPTYDSSDYDL